MIKIDKNRVISETFIERCIEQDREEQARKEKLLDYYNGKHDILGRQFDDPTKPNNKIVNNYASFITNIACSYILGGSSPITYRSEDEELLNQLKAINTLNDATYTNLRNGMHISQCGVTYEVVYVDEEGNIKFSPLGSLGGIPIYSNEIDPELLAFIRYYEETDIETRQKIRYIELYDANFITRYKYNTQGFELIEQKAHIFGICPVIVYYNNEAGKGDYEDIISLIDAYNSLTSNNINESDYSNDSYLVLTGLMGTEAEDIAAMKENRVMLLPDAEAKAEFLIKNLNNSFIENQLKSIETNIFSLSLVPNLTDQNFAGNSSGVAMAYKLQGLEQLANIKVAEFTKALRRRMRLICIYLKVLTGQEHDYMSVEFTWTRNTPKNLAESAETAQKLVGLVSQETILQTLPLDIDPKAELEKIDEEATRSLDPYDDQARWLGGEEG